MSTDPTLGVKDINFDDDDQEAENPKKEEPKAAETEIHIRIQQRNSRKSITIVQGLPPKLDLKKVLKYFKKKFCCNGVIVDDPQDEKVKILQITGDQRTNVAEFLINEKIARKELVKVHGI